MTARPRLGGRAALLLALALTSVGCASTRRDIDMAPTPAALPVFGAALTDGDGEGAARQPVGQLLLAVTHAERRGGTSDGPWELVLRLRLENRTADDLRLVPGALRAVDADLSAFGPPAWDDLPPDAALTAGQNAVWQARLPFPGNREPGDRSLRGLQLHAELLVDGEPRVLDLTLERVEPTIQVDAGPYPVGAGFAHPRYGFGYGYGWYGGLGPAWGW